MSFWSTNDKIIFFYCQDYLSPQIVPNNPLPGALIWKS